MDRDTLFVVLGDSPRMPTGLGRISGDIAAHLHQASDRLGIQLVQVGWEYGRPALHHIPWDLVTFPEIAQDWGAGQILPFIEGERARLGLTARQVVLLTVWDPARCFEYRQAEYDLWGYFAVDGHNRNGSFGGPAADTVNWYDRVLAYTAYGAGVLRKVLDAHGDTDSPVHYLPHGHYWGEAEYAQAQQDAQPPAEGWRLGCVASNTPRKDLGLFFAVIAELRAGGERVYGWLHTDELVTGAWSIPELLEVYKVDPSWIQVTLPPAGDAWLRAMYASCAVTLAPGRGEGFCYPIIESYAMGRPVVHADYAGGRELTMAEGRMVPAAFDETNPYCVRRPLLHAGDVAGRCQQLAHQMLERSDLGPFYAGSVAHLQWQHCWPRWETWVRQGLQQLRERR